VGRVIRKELELCERILEQPVDFRVQISDGRKQLSVPRSESGHRVFLSPTEIRVLGIDIYPAFEPGREQAKVPLCRDDQGDREDIGDIKAEAYELPPNGCDTPANQRLPGPRHFRPLDGLLDLRAEKGDWGDDQQSEKGEEDMISGGESRELSAELRDELASVGKTVGHRGDEVPKGGGDDGGCGE